MVGPKVSTGTQRHFLCSSVQRHQSGRIEIIQSAHRPILISKMVLSTVNRRPPATAVRRPERRSGSIDCFPPVRVPATLNPQRKCSTDRFPYAPTATLGRNSAAACLTAVCLRQVSIPSASWAKVVTRSLDHTKHPQFPPVFEQERRTRVRLPERVTYCHHGSTTPRQSPRLPFCIPLWD